MDTSRLRFGETVAAGSGVLLAIAMFLAWYGVDIGGLEDSLGAPDTTANAWQSFGFIDILLFCAVIVSVGLAALTMTQRSVALPVAASVLTTAAGAFATLLILFRIVNKPDSGPFDLDLKFGIFLGLLAAIGIAVGGYLSMQEEGTSISEAVDDIRGGGSGEHPPAQPAPPPSAPAAPPADPPTGGSASPPSQPPPGGGV